MLPLLGLIPLLPLLGFLVCGLLGKRLSRKAVTILAGGSVGLAFLISLGAVIHLGSLPPGARSWSWCEELAERETASPPQEFASYEARYWMWIPAIPFESAQEGDASPEIPSSAFEERGSSALGTSPAGPLEIVFGLRLDPLSSILILIVTGVGFLIHLYSAGYMAHDPGYARYFAYLNLFTAMMLTLVLASNFLLMFVGWEGVGLCSYLLIGFWYEDEEKAQAGRKAFIVNRVGDCAFILGVLAIVYLFRTLDFTEVMATISQGHVSTAALTAIGLALFVGACGKSAQIPLYVWLPDAMAGPTPVSALIHAATMVTAGVYMVARCSALYVHAPGVLAVVAVVGAATALFAATIGVAQTDIKKVLAYSTVSQLGYMFLGAGVGAFGASIFHLMTHAFFKALLFLGAGSVIHAMGGEQDMRRMGGLKDKLPWTYRTMLVAALAIAGIPVLSGFFSKDEILWQTWRSGHPFLWLIGAGAAGLTAFYIFRLVYLTFHGTFRGTPEQAYHLHESPPSMLVPLVVLAFLSIVGGWVGIPHALGGFAGIPNYLERSLQPVFATALDVETGGHAGGPSPMDLAPALRTALPASSDGSGHSAGEPAEFIFMMVAIAIAVAGILTARAFYRRPSLLPGRIAAAAGPFYQLVLNKYWVDELYEATVLRAYYGVCSFFESVDRWIIDGLVNAIGAFTEMIGQILRLFQTGFVRHYALWIFLGAVLLVWMLGR